MHEYYEMCTKVIQVIEFSDCLLIISKIIASFRYMNKTDARTQIDPKLLKSQWIQKPRKIMFYIKSPYLRAPEITRF